MSTNVTSAGVNGVGTKEEGTLLAVCACAMGDIRSCSVGINVCFVEIGDVAESGIVSLRSEERVFNTENAYF